MREIDPKKISIATTEQKYERRYSLTYCCKARLFAIVRLLIDKAKDLGEEDIENGAGKGNIVRLLIKMANNNNDTALHLAVRGDNLEVVKHLTEICPEFEYFPNHAGETPLYLAALMGWPDAVSQILETCKSSAHSGPDGKTALHASVMVDNEDIMQSLLKLKPEIAKETDKHGWTPLHYVAHSRFFIDATMLLRADSTVAYIVDKRGFSPLHVAAGRGKFQTVEVILEHCPDCWEIPDHRGRNYLHIAIKRGEGWMIRDFLPKGITSKECINQPDNDGNTPLHLAAIHEVYDSVQLLCNVNGVKIDALHKENCTALQIIIAKELPKGKYLRKGLEAACQSLRNSSKWPKNVDMINWEDSGLPSKGEDKKRKKRSEENKRMREKMEKASSNHLVVAALIATVAFAAGFAVPGGYDGDDSPNKGMATLIKAIAFRVFAISNTIAMLLSSLAVLVHFFMNLGDEQDTDTFLMTAFHCTFGAILAMMLAFITGTYSVLAHAPALAITTCAFGCIFYPVSYYLLHYALKSKIVRDFLFQPTLPVLAFLFNRFHFMHGIPWVGDCLFRMEESY